MRIAVCYAGQHGSTAGIADRVATVLRGEGAEVTVAPVQGLGGVEDYDAVVLGSAVHNQRWLPAAESFLARNEAALRRGPTWLFSVGMSQGLPRPLRRMARDAQAKRIEAAHPLFAAARGHMVFSGAMRPDQMPRWIGTLFRAVGGRFGDYRDWAEIDAWSSSILRDLGNGGGDVVPPAP